MAMLKPAFDNAKDHYSGLHSPIELVEYGEFQCLHCAEVYPVIKLLQEHLVNSLQFIFRHYLQPVRNPLSLDASVAAETEGGSDDARLDENFAYIYALSKEDRDGPRNDCMFNDILSPGRAGRCPGAGARSGKGYF